MKLYIKEFYKPAERYFLCKEYHYSILSRSYKSLYVLYDLKNKCYLRLISWSGFKSGFVFKPTNSIIPYYYTEDDIPTFTRLGVIPYNEDTIYPALYCQERFGK